MKAIVVGCGKVGSCLANSLAREGDQGAIVDRNPGVEEADAFAAVTESDYANIMAGLIAKEIFHAPSVPRVIARVVNPKHQKRIFYR